MSTNKNTGYNPELELQHRSEADYTYGALTLPCIAEIPTGERSKYLPRGEVQVGAEDMMDCASRSPVNLLETKFNYLVANKKISTENIRWLKDNGYINDEGRVDFSDAFIAILSKTGKNGNSLIAPLDAIHNYGLVPKKRIPLEKWMTFDQYHNPKRITPELRKLGEDFEERFTIKYYRVDEGSFKEVLHKDMFGTAGHAWPTSVNGEYPRTNSQPNHAFLAFDLPKYYIFDNYFDNVDGDFIKKLTQDYDLVDFGYLVKITSEQVLSTETTKSFWERMVEFLRRFAIIPEPIVEPVTLSNREKLHITAISCLNTDASPDDKAPDELGCMESVAGIFKKALGYSIGEETSTYRFYDVAHKSPFLRKVDLASALPGDIILSATGHGNGKMKSGHVGIMDTGTLIMSNESSSGLFKRNYTLQTWKDRYVKIGGFPIDIFRVRD